MPSSGYTARLANRQATIHLHLHAHTHNHFAHTHTQLEIVRSNFYVPLSAIAFLFVFLSFDQFNDCPEPQKGIIYIFIFSLLNFLFNLFLIVFLFRLAAAHAELTKPQTAVTFCTKNKLPVVRKSTGLFFS